MQAGKHWRIKLIKKLAAAAALVLGGLGVIGVSDAGAAQYDRCPNGGTDSWYVHTNYGAGQTMHCHADGNHITIDWYVGSQRMGLVYEAWHPADMVWFLEPFPTDPGYSALNFCPNYISMSSPNRLVTGTGPAGWEHQFFTPTGTPLGGAFNHWHGTAVKPYALDGGRSQGSSNCVNYTGIQAQSVTLSKT